MARVLQIYKLVIVTAKELVNTTLFPEVLYICHEVRLERSSLRLCKTSTRQSVCPNLRQALGKRYH